MTAYNFIIDYTCFDQRGVSIKSGTIKAKKKTSEFDALSSLEKHFKKTVPNFASMKYSSIRKETLADMLGSQAKDLLNDLFK